MERDEMIKKLEEDKKSSQIAIEALLKKDMMDEDGYPTIDALEIVKLWHWSDEQGWFDFIKSLWYMADYGWNEVEEASEHREENVYRYYISTVGWSGNESIIRAMKENVMLWDGGWIQSRRGGHYIFELEVYNPKINRPNT